MRVAKLYEQKKPILSFEFFPPRNKDAESGFYKVLDELTKLHPDYMTMTFGAGGSTRDGSYQAVKTMVEEKKIPTVAYLAGYGLDPAEVDLVLKEYETLGVETIFVIRGDKPQNKDFKPHPDSFGYASDLIAFIKKNYSFDIGCAGYPEGHIAAESLEKDMEFLKLKVENGAQYIISQYCYDNDIFFNYVEKCRAAGIKVPIIPGIMPVYTIKLTRMLSKICGSSVPGEMEDKLEALSGKDPQEVLDYGAEFALNQSRDLLERGVDGLHFYTMNRSKSVIHVLNTLKNENNL